MNIWLKIKQAFALDIDGKKITKTKHGFMIYTKANFFLIAQKAKWIV